MFIDDSASKSKRLDHVETALWAGRLDRRTFIKMAIVAGLSSTAAWAFAQDADAIAKNQQALAANLRKSYDYIVCGAGSSGSFVARRLAENKAVQVLLIEAGGSDDSPRLPSCHL